MTIISSAIPLIALTEIQKDEIKSVDKDGIHFLVISQNDDIYVVEDRCGHFGVSMKEGSVRDKCIRCPAHGAKFHLESGELLNDLFEDCDPINVFLWQKKDGWLEVII